MINKFKAMKYTILFLLLTISLGAQDTLTFQDVDWDGLMDLTEDPCVDRDRRYGQPCDDGFYWTTGETYAADCTCTDLSAGSSYDPIDSLLTTSKTAWGAAAPGDVIEITQAEWDSLVANLTDATTSGTPTSGGTYYGTGAGETWSRSNNASYVTPVNGYVAAFYIDNNDTNTGSTSKTAIKTSSTSATSGYSTWYTFTFNWGLPSYFLVKGGIPYSAGQYIAIFGGAPFSRPLVSPGAYWDYGNVNTIPTLNGTSQEQEFLYFPHFGTWTE